MKTNLRLTPLLLILALLNFVGWKAGARSTTDFEAWLLKQNSYSLQQLKNNIHPKGTQPGVVVASPSQRDPDYWYHWTRDAALVMDVIVERLIQNNPKDLFSDAEFRILHDYVIFSRQNQLSNAPTGLGEPKFYVDGSPYLGPWGRPQNDGPALRAHTLSRLALYMLDRGEANYVGTYLYQSDIPATRVIKTDLEYVSHEWPKTNFDLWEEVKGQHFYTRLVQWRSLRLGAILAERLNDPGAASWYAKQARALAVELQAHWDGSQQILRTTLWRDGGLDYKHSGLDASTVLAYLHIRTSDLPVSTDQILSTAAKTEESFRRVYPLNQGGPATAIGRYPEDRYYGGNPWFLTTAAYAELYYRTALDLLSQGQVKVNSVNQRFYRPWVQLNAQPTGQVEAQLIQRSSPKFNKIVEGLIANGDAYLKRVRLHAGVDGQLDEQFDRDNGHMRSAHHLTWSYASILTAYDIRQQLMARLRTKQ